MSTSYFASQKYFEHTFCPHNEKYSFQFNSPLASYMLKCKGFCEDIDKKYTVNYIILTLLMNIKEKRHLLEDICKDFYIICDNELQKIFSLHCPILPVQFLREKILKHMYHREHITFEESALYAKPLWCVRHMDRILNQIFDNIDECRRKIIHTRCH